MRELKEVNYLFSTIPDTRVYLMAGNHDFISRDSFYRTFEWNSNVTFFKNRELTCVKDPELDVYVYGLSYYDREIREGLYDKAVPVQEEGIHILLAHGGDEKHIPLSAASLAAAGFDYVALGHIHKPMKVGKDTIRYCGTPYPYSVEEGTQQKGVILAELGAKGEKIITSVLPLNPWHRVREIKGTFAQICGQACDDYVRVVLQGKEEESSTEVSEKLHLSFPHLLEIRREQKYRQPGYRTGQRSDGNVPVVFR